MWAEKKSPGTASSVTRAKAQGLLILAPAYLWFFRGRGRPRQWPFPRSLLGFRSLEPTGPQKFLNISMASTSNILDLGALACGLGIVKASESLKSST